LRHFRWQQNPLLIEKLCQIDLAPASPSALHSGHDDDRLLEQLLRVQIVLYERTRHSADHQVQCPLSQLAKIQCDGVGLTHMERDPRKSLGQTLDHHRE
jgi:hypothetical protein